MNPVVNEGKARRKIHKSNNLILQRELILFQTKNILPKSEKEYYVNIYDYLIHNRETEMC